MEFKDKGNGFVLRIEGENWYVSYIPAGKESHLDPFLRLLGIEFLPSEEETSLVVPGEGFFTLLGDFREEFRKAAEEGGFRGCRSLYEKKKHLYQSPNSWDFEGAMVH